jgi:hypothetical protein
MSRLSASPSRSSLPSLLGAVIATLAISACTTTSGSQDAGQCTPVDCTPVACAPVDAGGPVACIPVDAGTPVDPDPVVLKFATVGDSREDPTTKTLTAQDKIWLQNTRVWSRMLREIAEKKPSMLFFNGDMTMGYKDAAVAANHEAMNQQYAFWRGMVTQVIEVGTYVVPVPGNHETQDKAAGKISKVANEILWRDNMADLVTGLGASPVTVGGFTMVTGETASRFDPAFNPFDAGTAAADHITTDQAELSYSFDVGTAHFAVINTDPVGYDAHAPANWIAADFDAAKARGAKHFFAFGHKPAFSYVFPQADGGAPGPNGLDTVADKTGRDSFWSAVADAGATYFCGHEHIYNVSQPAGGTAYQVIVGSGGSPFETDAQPGIDRTYAYAIVEIRTSGKVHVTAYGFAENLGATTVLRSWDLN